MCTISNPATGRQSFGGSALALSKLAFVALIGISWWGVVTIALNRMRLFNGTSPASAAGECRGRVLA
jgi:hypothetical protein